MHRLTAVFRVTSLWVHAWLAEIGPARDGAGGARHGREFPRRVRPKGSP
jgi:hypothetical protein